MTMRKKRHSMPGYSRAALAVGLAAGALTGAVAPGMAAEVSSGNDAVSLTLSGQVNRGLLYADDGTNSNVAHVDNDNSSTRFRMIGKGTLNEDITVGTQIEVQMESNSTANINIDGSTTGGNDGLSFTERKLEAFIDSKRFGRLWIGQGDTASNGTSEVDLSGTSVVAYSGIADMAGGIDFGGFDFVAGAPLVADSNIGTVFSNFDGLSRDDRIRYDTPNFGGFMLSASNSDRKKSDVALRFSGDIGGGLKLAAAAAYAIDGDIDPQINGSASILHESGFNLTGAAGQRELDDPARLEDPFFWYAKIGYILKGDNGSTAFAIDYTEADDVEFDNDEFTSYGVSVVHKFDKIGTDLYLAVRNHELDRPAANFDDILAVLGGARVKF